MPIYHLTDLISKLNVAELDKKKSLILNYAPKTNYSINTYYDRISSVDRYFNQSNFALSYHLRLKNADKNCLVQLDKEILDLLSLTTQDSKHAQLLL